VTKVELVTEESVASVIKPLNKGSSEPVYLKITKDCTLPAISDVIVRTADDSGETVRVMPVCRS
jgi:hypothetical protein